MISDIDMEQLEEVRQKVLSQLREKHGVSRVQYVDDLGEAVTLRMLNGETVDGVESWAYQIVSDFEYMLLDHLNIKMPTH